MKCTQRWMTSDSVAQHPSPQGSDSWLASVRVSRSASAPDVVDSFVDMSSGSVQIELGVPTLPTTVPSILVSCTHTGSLADNVLDGCARWYRS